MTTAQGATRRNVSLSGVLAQSVGFMGPVFSVATLLPLIVGLSATGRGAGVATPVALAVAGLGMFGAGWVIAQYARRIHLCGSLYEYVSDTFGARTGLVAGWLYYGAMLILSAATILVLGGLTEDFLRTALGLSLPWWLLSLGYTAVVAAVVLIGVQVSVRAQLALVLVSAVVVLLFSIYIIVKGGAGGTSVTAKPFNPFAVSGADLLYGVLYGINMFIGYESAANLAEETDDPKRHIPRAVLWSLTIVGVYYLVTAYAQAVGFGLDAQAWKASIFPLQALASGGEFGSSAFGNLMAVIIVLDVVAVAIGVGVAGSRGMYAMARSGRLPRVLASVSPRFGTPVVAAVVIAAFSVAAVAVVVATDGVFSRATADPAVQQPQWAPMFSWMAGFAGTGLALMYLAVCVAGARGLWGHVSTPKLVVATAAGALVSAGAVFGSVYKAPSPLDTVPWAMAAWLVVGVAWSFVVDVRPEPDEAPVAALGSRLGGEAP